MGDQGANGYMAGFLERGIDRVAGLAVYSRAFAAKESIVTRGGIHDKTTRAFSIGG